MSRPRGTTGAGRSSHRAGIPGPFFLFTASAEFAPPPKRGPAMRITTGKALVCSSGRNLVTLKLETGAGVRPCERHDGRGDRGGRGPLRGPRLQGRARAVRGAWPSSRASSNAFGPSSALTSTCCTTPTTGSRPSRPRGWGGISSPPACSFTRVTPRASAWISTRRRPISIRTDGPACPWRGSPMERFRTGETGRRGSSPAEQRGKRQPADPGWAPGAPV